MATEKVAFTQARETLLATLYGRALDSRSKNPVLGDHAAAEAVERIDYDFRKPRMTAMSAAGVAMRARLLDVWTREFLADHRQAVVLHLACGLDTRVFRVDPGPGVRWFDVDYPDVIELRRRLLPDRDEYRTIGTSVTDDGWLDQVPADRPAIVVAEGLTMYLTKAEGRQLITRLTDHFPGGQLVFDVYGTRGIRIQKWVPAVKQSGATLHWGVDDPHELEAWHEGLTCMTAIDSFDVPGADQLPRSTRLLLRACAAFPLFKNIGQVLRYRF